MNQGTFTPVVVTEKYVIDPETLRYHKTLALPKNFHQKPVSERLIQTKLSFLVRTPSDPGRWSERLLVRKCTRVVGPKNVKVMSWVVVEL